MKNFFLLLLIFVSLNVFATVPSWQIDAAKSELKFQAVQNNSPITGSFAKFTGEINGDPNHLDESRIQIVVYMASVSTAYDEVQNTLKEPSWFDVNVFPKATFTADKFKKTGQNSYVADGMLTLRDKTLPIKLYFDLKSYSDNTAVVTGQTVIQRTAFGVGQGEWSSTNEVQDAVQVTFRVTLRR